ncbi:MAG: glutamate mutase L, partial [Symbiobacteriaceae bacterium]|nr:glutamate mutase L [Symbiobacteriaceae bacterium]
MKRMVIVDVGSTTTKALLFQEEAGVWHLLFRGEAGTTVEAPDEDVMVGVRRSIQMLQDRSGITLLGEGDNGELHLSSDHFLATSSAGGGLQMVVCGNVGNISAESAERAAMGGGAILLDLFSNDDGLSQFQRLERLRHLRPDMILLSGGIEGASVIGFVVEMCDFIRTARPRPKFGYTHALPVIYAGSSSGIPVVEDLLGEGFVLKIVPNLRPGIAEENLGPTREAIHDLFIEHVMSNAPGYGRLQRQVTWPLIPTPVA